MTRCNIPPDRVGTDLTADGLLWVCLSFSRAQHISANNGLGACTGRTNYRSRTIVTSQSEHFVHFLRFSFLIEIMPTMSALFLYQEGEIIDGNHQTCSLSQVKRNKIPVPIHDYVLFAWPKGPFGCNPSPNWVRVSVISFCWVREPTIGVRA